MKQMKPKILENGNICTLCPSGLCTLMWMKNDWKFQDLSGLTAEMNNPEFLTRYSH